MNDVLIQAFIFLYPAVLLIILMTGFEDGQHLIQSRKAAVAVLFWPLTMVLYLSKWIVQFTWWSVKNIVLGFWEFLIAFTKGK